MSKVVSAARIRLKRQSVFRANRFTSNIVAQKPPRTVRAMSSMVEVYRVFYNHSISLMPRFTGMRDGAGVGAGAGCVGGAGLSLAMIASRW